MKYKLLVLDVDGTLLNNQKEISPRTLAALLKVQQMGILCNRHSPGNRPGGDGQGGHQPGASV